MSDLKDGDYVLKVAVGSQPLAGIDIGGNLPLPVITNGSENVVSPLVFVQRVIRSTLAVHFVLFSYTME